MSARLKILTTMIFPRGSVNPEALIGKRIEIVQLGREDCFLVDRVEYDAENPHQVELCIYPIPVDGRPTTSPRLKGKR